jgi:tetratricopeptide (TPR) repeat protein
LDPYSGSAHNVTGQSYSALGNFKKALHHYNFTIEQSKQLSNPHQQAETLNLKAHSLFNMGRVDNALECNNEAIELSPHNIVLYLDRAKMFLAIDET